MLLNLSFQLSNHREVLAEYPDQVKEIFSQITQDGFNTHDSKAPGQSVYIMAEDIQWMLVRDQDCLGNAEVDTTKTSIHIRYDSLDFKLGAVWGNGVIWKSDTLVRMNRPSIVQHKENIKKRPYTERRKSKLALVGKPGQFLHPQTDITESKRNRGYPVPEKKNNTPLRIVDEDNNEILT
ncbi:hypothetical protein KAR91_87000 [Candidatus Pacearchaeota archaeon]|nr:hypothetical protein [Candidatus Pacearchaeota archaeon]